jgi:hypothetical protein
MGIKVIRDFQEKDTVVIRLEFEGLINLTGNSFNITLSSNLNNTPQYDVTFAANSNGHPDDNLAGGIINLSMNTASIPPGTYMYSITRIVSGAITTIARSGLNSVDTVECKKQL